MRRPLWLDRESEGWERDGIISPSQRAAILGRYGALHERSAAAILIWLAVLTGGAGLVLLAGWNWDLIPPATKLAVLLNTPGSQLARVIKAKSEKA